MIIRIPQQSTEADVYSISNGMLTASLMRQGARLQHLSLTGFEHSLVVGTDNLALYSDELRYAGAIVGPVANRIANGRFQLNGVGYQVDQNYLGRHCLHGGEVSPSDMDWEVKSHSSNSICFELNLADNHMGFPGPSSVEVDYTISADSSLTVYIRVQSPVHVACNWTQHSYFNLDGEENLNSHQLQIFADHYLPVDEELIPTGEIQPVAGSQFDFKQLRSLADTSLDHNFCVAETRYQQLRKHALLRSEKSGISMLLESTEPGVQVYTGDHFSKGFAGLALEPQGWPDALNHQHFPSIQLCPGDTYVHRIRYSFNP